MLSNRWLTVKLVLQVFTTPVKTSGTSSTKQIHFPHHSSAKSSVIVNICGPINERKLVLFGKIIPQNKDVKDHTQLVCNSLGNNVSKQYLHTPTLKFINGCLLLEAPHIGMKMYLY